MKNLILGLVVSFAFASGLSAVAYAAPVDSNQSLHGSWTGWAYWHFQGSNEKCYSNIQFSESSAQITRQEGFVDCDFAGIDMGEVALQKDGQGNLLFDSEVVGHYSEYKMDWVESYSPTVNIEVTIELGTSKTNMNYNERWVNLQGEEIYFIENRLFKKQ